MSSCNRKLEELLIGLGGQRCGSSWLHEMLAEHPQILPANGEKETHFFDRRWEKGVDWYQARWPNQVPKGTLRWESTPSYLYYADVRARIAQTVPQARFVVLLRDPAERSLSHYRRYQTNSGQSLSLSDAAAQRRTILEFSAYAENLAAYFKSFGRDRFFVGLYEDIAQRPAELYRDILDFAGVDPFELPGDVLERRVNEVRLPRGGAAYANLYGVKRRLQKVGLGGVAALARRSGMLDLIASNKTPHSHGVSLSLDETALLERLRAEQITALAELDIDSSLWAERPVPLAASPRLSKA